MPCVEAGLVNWVYTIFQKGRMKQKMEKQQYTQFVYSAIEKFRKKRKDGRTSRNYPL